MKHTIKEAIKLSDAHKKGRVIQRTEYPYLRWENIEDFNENYVLEERYKYRVFPYFRLPTEEEFESITQEFTKVDYDKKSRVYLDEKSGNKLQFYYIRLFFYSHNAIDYQLIFLVCRCLNIRFYQYL